MFSIYNYANGWVNLVLKVGGDQIILEFYKNIAIKRQLI
jgi:hypothetical protein